MTVQLGRTEMENNMKTSKNVFQIGCNDSKVEYSAIQGCAYEVEFFDEIIIEEGITRIGYCAFKGQSRVTKVTLPNTLKEIGWSAFDDCASLTEITIPGNVTIIGDGAFRGCTGLTSVVIPSGVEKIERDAFRGCTGLTSVVIPDSVKTIGTKAFFGCVNLKEPLFAGSKLVVWPQATDKITIPSGITEISALKRLLVALG